MPRVAAEEIITKLFSRDEHFAETLRGLDVTCDGEVEKFEGAVDGGEGAIGIALLSPFE